MKIALASAITAGLAAVGDASAVLFPLTGKNMPSNKGFGSYMMNNRAGRNSLYLRDTVETNVSLTTSYNFYVTNISIGTPGQDLEVGFDTGSPYLWVYGPNDTFEDAKQFYPEKSDSFEPIDKNFTIQYGAGMFQGKWGSDDVHVGDYVAEDFPFGVIEQFHTTAGVPGLIGIGPGPNLTNETYSNVPEAFYQNNVTESPIFSVYLDANSDNGGVIFGGHDPTKYEKPIYQYEIVSNSQTMPTYYYQVRLDSLALNGEDYKVSNVVVLDTGSPFCQLPPGFVEKLGKKLGFKQYEKYQAWYAEKDVKVDPSIKVSFNIGKLSVDVPAKDLLVPGEHLWVDDGPKDKTALAIMGARSYVLGDVFFKHVYAGFDSLNRKIYLAKATNNFKRDKVTEIKGTEFPGAVDGAEGDETETTLTPRPSGTSAPSTGGGGQSPGGAAPENPAAQVDAEQLAEEIEENQP
ncbi:hypothetical protein TRICI_004412 [Trichomonascus ciferrii]|uniref:Peptidase A1 domain-containing protein n=1 Tax=Trichomonascus ciferrii TaxID=44093 RepID=A0A642V5Z5_9ASCO|nr:hypothetical protein TRICI_004412 [Trichomonascus ciferrii]